MADKPYEGTQLWFAAQAIHEQLNDPTVELAFGIDELDKNKGRRRIVWVRPGGTTNPPDRGGGLYRSPAEVEAEKEQVPTGKPVEAPSGTRVQFCYQPVDQVFAHLFAETDKLLEQLLYNLLAAIKIACGHLAMPGAYIWPNELDGRLGKRQSKIQLRVDFTFAAPEEISALTTILHTQHTHDFNGGDEGGEGTHD